MFVTLEGIDRSGKTTQAALLAEALGPETLLLREPGGPTWRSGSASCSRTPPSSSTRAPSCSCSAPPALSSAHAWYGLRSTDGRDVVCDRFIDSTVAYQGAARGLGVRMVEGLNEVAIAGCSPQLTVLLRIDPEKAEARGQQRLAAGQADGSDRFEGEGIELPARGRRRIRRARRAPPRADRRDRRRGPRGARSTNA